MSEEKDDAQMREELAQAKAGHNDGAPGDDEMKGVPPQMQPTPGSPVRQGEIRREERVREMLDTLPQNAQDAIREEWAARGRGNGNATAGVGAAAAATSSDSVDDHYGSSAQ